MKAGKDNSMQRHAVAGRLVCVAFRPFCLLHLMMMNADCFLVVTLRGYSFVFHCVQMYWPWDSAIVIAIFHRVPVIRNTDDDHLYRWWCGLIWYHRLSCY